MVHVVVVHVVDQRILELCMYVIMYVCVCMYVVLFEEEKTDTRIIYTYVGSDFEGVVHVHTCIQIVRFQLPLAQREIDRDRDRQAGRQREKKEERYINVF